jgi:uncharacterized beta barrel domain-containing protein DUF5777
MTIRKKAVWGGSILLLALVAARPARAQTPQNPPAPAASEPQAADPDTRVDALQPDFNLTALPTTLRMPEGKFAFRVTHRFNRSLGRGDFGDLLNDFFGFDSGAQIGLEVRYGLLRGTQVGIHRTSDRTIELFGQQSLMQERDGKPIGLDAIVTFEGLNNLRDQKMPAVGLIASKKISRVASVYAEPVYVFNTFVPSTLQPVGTFTGADKNTLMVGLGARVRIAKPMYLVGEITPRLAGYDPGVNQISFGLEGRAGGHTFQVNFSNGLGTTLGQLARGGIDNNSWFIGFNISRKFF